MGPVGTETSSKRAVKFRQRAISAILPQLLTACVVVACVLMFSAYFLPTPTYGDTPTAVTSCGTYSGNLVLTRDISTNNGNCLTLTSNSSLDGAGHAISVGAGNYAVWVYNQSHVAIANIVTSNNIYIAEDSGSGSEVSLINSSVGAVTVYRTDDVTIDHVTMASANIYGEHTDPVLRTVFTNNTVTGNAQTLVSFLGGDDHAPCPRTEFVVTDNVLTSSYQCGAAGQDRCDEPKVLFMYCGTHNTVQNNVVRALGQAMAARFRDNFDDSTVSHNVFWAHEPQYPFGAVTINDGSVDTTAPARNTFSHNTFRTDIGPAIYFPRLNVDNRFEYNVIWGNDSRNIGTIDGGYGNVFDHNTIYNSATGPLFVMSYRTAPTDIWTNNIFDHSGTNIFNYDGFNFAYYSGNNNIFHNRAGSVSFGGSYPSLASWKSAATPDDSASLGIDPLMTNPGSGDFSLGATSLARGAGTSGSDIGAIETTSSTCTESWSCGAWSDCTNQLQSRNCTDTNNCGTITSRPTLSQSCSTNPGPTVKIVYPTGKRTISGRYLVTVSAKDANGVARANFFINGVQFGTDKTSPYRAWLDTRTLRNGEHTLLVQVTDKLGASTTAERSFKVKNPLLVRISVPLTNKVIKGTITLQPKLIYGGTPVTLVEYWIDRRLYQTTTTAPYAVNWSSTSVRNGVHRFTIRVTDSTGARATHTVNYRVKN